MRMQCLMTDCPPNRQNSVPLSKALRMHVSLCFMPPVCLAGLLFFQWLFQGRLRTRQDRKLCGILILLFLNNDGSLADVGLRHGWMVRWIGPTSQWAEVLPFLSESLLRTRELRHAASAPAQPIGMCGHRSSR